MLVLRVALTGDFADARVGDFAGVRTGDLARRGVAAVALAGVEDFAGVRGILRKGGKSERAFDNARPNKAANLQRLFDFPANRRRIRISKAVVVIGGASTIGDEAFLSTAF